MPRMKAKRYQQRVMAAMSIYAAMMLAWPLARTVSPMPLKWLLALAPLLPMLYVIALMAHRIRDSDELEQRTHLIGLGVATAVVAALSLAGGFLASAQLLSLDGSVLIWVFPVIMACYGTTRWWVVRSYGGNFGCDASDAMALHWRLAIPAAMLAAVALVAFLNRDDFHAGLLVGMASSIAVVAVAKGVIQWRRRHATSAGKEGY